MIDSWVPAIAIFMPLIVQQNIMNRPSSPNSLISRELVPSFSRNSNLEFTEIIPTNLLMQPYKVLLFTAKFYVVFLIYFHYEDLCECWDLYFQIFIKFCVLICLSNNSFITSLISTKLALPFLLCILHRWSNIQSLGKTFT